MSQKNSRLPMVLAAFFISTLLAAGETASPKGPPKPDAAHIKTLLDALGNDSFDEREKATEELVKLGPAAIDAILAREKESPELEIRARCAKLREAIGDPTATALAVLAKIEKTEATFVRPGASRLSLTKHYFTGIEFAKHLRTKAAVQNVTLTTPAGEFVDKIASESALKQTPYTVRLADGTERELRAWLSETLKLKPADPKAENAKK